jgi:hypothetical protein
MKQYDKQRALNDMDGALALTHGIKLNIEHTGDFTEALGINDTAIEVHALDMLNMIHDIELTLKSLKGVFNKELRDARDRQSDDQ